MGRRPSLVAAAALFILGAIVMSWAYSFTILLLGRVVTGLGVGFGLTLAPVYTSELSPHYSRGTLVSMTEVFMNLGITIGYCACFSLSGLTSGWRVMLGLGALPAIALGAGVLLLLPETPRWLVMMGRSGEALTILRKLYGSKVTSAYDVDDPKFCGVIVADEGEEEAQKSLMEIIHSVGGQDELQELQSLQDVKESDARLERMGFDEEGSGGGAYSGSQAKKSPWQELICASSPALQRLLLLCIGTNFFHQATGIDAMVFYSPTIFKAAGYVSKLSQLTATLGVGITRTVSVLLSTLFVDHYGRRPLLLASTCGMAFSMLMMSLGFQLHAPPGTSGTGSNASGLPAGGVPALLIMFGACSFVSFFSIGLGPICWVLSSEIFPNRLRSQGFAVGTSVNRAVSGVVSLTFLSLGNTIHPSRAFLVLASASILATVFFSSFAPETKGKTLEQLEQQLSAADRMNGGSSANNVAVELLVSSVGAPAPAPGLDRKEMELDEGEEKNEEQRKMQRQALVFKLKNFASRGDSADDWD